MQQENAQERGLDIYGFLASVSSFEFQCWPENARAEMILQAEFEMSEVRGNA